MLKDFYDACQILGIDHDDSNLADTAKKAFRRLSKELHPDKVGAHADTEQFTRVTEAYSLVKQVADNPIPHASHQDWNAPQQGFHINFGIGAVTVPPGSHIHQQVDANGNVHVTISFG